MALPTITQFNNAIYYKQKLPSDLAESRLWQLVYGEFRAPKYMAVLRKRLEGFNWVEFDARAAVELYRLTTPWVLMSKNRRVEWPVVNQLVRAFRDKLLETGDGIDSIHQAGTMSYVWIDDNAEWDRLVTQPYEALQR